jgi:hypothetical protein
MKLVMVLLTVAVALCAGIIIGALHFSDDAIAAYTGLGVCSGANRTNQIYIKGCVETLENDAAELYECEQRLLTCARSDRE